MQHHFLQLHHIKKVKYTRSNFKKSKVIIHKTKVCKSHWETIATPSRNTNRSSTIRLLNYSPLFYPQHEPFNAPSPNKLGSARFFIHAIAAYTHTHTHTVHFIDSRVPRARNFNEKNDARRRSSSIPRNRDEKGGLPRNKKEATDGKRWAIQSTK